MTIAGKINALFLAAAIILCGVTTAVIANRFYDSELERLVDTSRARALSRPDLQWHIYRRDQAQLEDALSEFITPGGIVSAIAYSNLGETLARRDGPGSRAAKETGFQAIRSSLLAVDTSLVAPGKGDDQIDAGLFTSVFNRDPPLYLSIPVFSVINPGKLGLQPRDFVAAMLEPQQPNLKQVVGYLHLVIDRGQLLAVIGPDVQRAFLIRAAVALVAFILLLLLSRHITRPLRQLTQLAEEVASGKLQEPVEIRGSADIQDIAQALNGVFGGMHDIRRESDTHRRLLNMKVEERSSQLSESNAELNKAVEEVAQTRHKLRHLANYDSLTNLPNRRLFSEQMELLLRLNRRNKQSLALLLVDLEDFKRVNESLGLAAGDQVLQEMARRLSLCIRESDSVGRLAGSQQEIGVSRLGADEFSVVLGQLDNDQAALQVARRLAGALTRPITIDDHEVVMQPRIGIAMAPRDGENVEALLQAATAARQHSRKSGREKIEIYRSDMTAATSERIKLESDLRRAVQARELVLHYQPQVDTNSGSVVGAEALLRWQHPELGLVSPGQFIGLAEEIGIIDQLGDWVLVEACRQFKAFADQGLKLPRVSINISSLQFNMDFVQRVAEVLQQSDLSPSSLELGLSEGIMADGDDATLCALHALKELGVYLSVDDFGNGYSPLSYLSHCPLDELKIDRRFLGESEQSESGARLVAGIIALARHLDIRLLAEGVETEKQFLFLNANGAHILQGYLFSKPVTAEELAVMLSPWHFMKQVQKMLDDAERSNTDRFLEETS